MAQKQAVFSTNPEVLGDDNSAPPLKVQNYSIVQVTPTLLLDNH